MSGSDSDLDYESADDSTDIDVTNKISVRQEKCQKEFKNDDLNKHVEFPECKLNADASKDETSNELLKEEIVNLNILQSKTDNDTRKNVDEVPSEIVQKSSSFKEHPKEAQKLSDINSSRDHSDTFKNQSEGGSANKSQPEKQRVTLRLEKKVQQKHQMSKENSVEKDSTASSVNLVQQTEVKSSWGFGSWGTNLLSTAASSVSTFTNQVSQGIGTVLETVENTLGAPSPEQLAVSLSKTKESDEQNETPIDNDIKDDIGNTKISTEEKDENVPEVTSSILPNVSSWTKVLENTGSRVLMGGLDTLELIGKKTFDIITEGDPGLRKKRAAFSEGITLSQILREAKAEADESKQEDDNKGNEAVHYSQMFDEYQGLVHLEALEMLSKQSQAKIQRLLMRLEKTADVRKTMEEIKSICENIPPLDDPTDCEDFEDFETVCKKYVLELNLAFNVENIVKAQKRITDVVKNYENATSTTSTLEEIYHSAICGLAEFTAKSMETFHKLAELILVQSALEPSVEYFATNLTGLTTVMCIEINNLSSRYHHCLDSFAEQPGNNSEKIVTSTVTNLYLEASNSNKYIQDAFLLLVPVLQVSLLESSQ